MRTVQRLFTVTNSVSSMSMSNERLTVAERVFDPFHLLGRQSDQRNEKSPWQAAEKLRNHENFPAAT